MYNLFNVQLISGPGNLSRACNQMPKKGLFRTNCQTISSKMDVPQSTTITKENVRNCSTSKLPYWEKILKTGIMIRVKLRDN